MAEEIAAFVAKHKGKKFPAGVKDPTDKTEKGQVYGETIKDTDPETVRLAKKHLRHISGNRAGNDDKLYNGATKDSLDNPKNKRLKGHGRNKDGDSMYESEEINEKEDWMKDAVKRPGALTKKANKAKESTTDFAKDHEDDKGRTGKQSRLAMTFAKFRPHKEEVEIDEEEEEIEEACAYCGKESCHDEHPQPELANHAPHVSPPKKKKLLLGGKLREDTLANHLALEFLSERKSLSAQHDTGRGKPEYADYYDNISRDVDGENQTDTKPAPGKTDKSKKQNYSYGQKGKTKECLVKEDGEVNPTDSIKNRKKHLTGNFPANSPSKCPNTSPPFPKGKDKK
jgi:hypothetical protein